MAKDWDEIAELCTLCAEGRLYEVEAWIDKGLPVQCEPPTERKLRKLRTPLQIAVKRGFYSLAELLLLNGYEPNGDASSSLRLAVEGKNVPMIDLLVAVRDRPATGQPRHGSRNLRPPDHGSIHRRRVRSVPG